MKKAVYNLAGGGEITTEYDENAPCRICNLPVIEASTSGTDVCSWCDVGRCRYCRVLMAVVKPELDGGRSLTNWREHMQWHLKPGTERR